VNFLLNAYYVVLIHFYYSVQIIFLLDDVDHYKHTVLKFLDYDISHSSDDILSLGDLAQNVNKFKNHFGNFVKSQFMFC